MEKPLNDASIRYDALLKSSQQWRGGAHDLSPWWMYFFGTLIAACFDAVSDDDEIVAVISTSAGFTSSGKVATAKLMKVRSNALWFLMLEGTPQKRLMIFTDQSMIDLVKDEKKKGRFPSEFQILKVTLPPGLAARVAESQRIASEEVSPKKASE